MSLHDQFRLHYGEGSGKKVDAAFCLFKLGYRFGLEEAAKIAEEAHKQEIEAGSSYKCCGIPIALSIRQMVKP